MYISLILIIIAGFTFTAWLFFLDRKEIPKEQYTEGLETTPLSDTEKMLENIVQKEIPEEEPLNENNVEVPENKNEEKQENENSEEGFDLKNAIISSTIINRK